MSSSEIAIQAIGLSKRYEIYDRPGDRLKQFIFPKLARLLEKNEKQYFQDFWALKDISFDLKKGQTLGIIGRNGSGKSTLLQLICGTLTPTSGDIQINGRIAALLELGSGFNPEFTGIENIFLNAAVLGLSTEQINERFDEICAFADIGEFIRQPVKTYSSGMLVRLAFAVIANVDADILVIDEALAVGDAIFTQKCMRFIRNFQNYGTLIFVSHDMGSVQNLCQEVLWLNKGFLKERGISKYVVGDYLQFIHQEVCGKEIKLKTEARALKKNQRDGNIDSPDIPYGSKASFSVQLNDANGWKTGGGEIRSLKIELLNGEVPAILKGGEIIRVVINAFINSAMDQPIIGFLLRDKLGQDLFGENTLPFTDSKPISASVGTILEATFTFRLPMLPNGEYTMMASLADGDLHNHVQHHWMHDALVINVFSSKVRWGLVGVEFSEVELRKAYEVIS